MQKRALGRSGIEIAPLVMGGNVFGWTADEATSFKLLDRFTESGFNAIDTADSYSAWAPGLSGGESEEIIGKWLQQRGRRDEVVIMTKVGMLEERKGLSAATIEAAAEESLKRLGTDYIDVYFAHVDDAATPLEESLTAFSRLVEAGKVRSIGASNYTADRLRSALEVSEQKALPRYEVLQPRYNLHDRQDFESGLGKVAQEQEIGVVCYFALASGFLTGKYRSAEEAAKSNRAGMLANYFDDRGMRILSAMNKIAEELAATPAQIALAWLMARPGVTAPIASATSVEQLDDIMKAARLELPEEVLGRLEEASA